MWMYLINFGIHWLLALAFFLLIPFPFFIKGMEEESALFIKRIYKWIIHFAHVAIVGTLITGIIIMDTWLSWWTLIIILLWLIIGAFLGFTAKSLKASLTSHEKQPLLKHSTILSVAITVMFVIKFSGWF